MNHHPIFVIAIIVMVTTAFLYGLASDNNLSVGEHRRTGWFRVLYSDGQVSQPFKFWTARDYAKMFDGRVVLKNSKAAKAAMEKL